MDDGIECKVVIEPDESLVITLPNGKVLRVDSLSSLAEEFISIVEEFL